jgi:Domain of unknown function (DUF4440)
MKTIPVAILAFMCGGLLFGLSAPVQKADAKTASPVVSNQRESDAKAIRAHIERIFQAFIDGDVDTIRATHADNWRGLLESRDAPIKGINEYMRANGIEWPPKPGVSRKVSYYPPGTTYRIRDFDLVFHGPDVAVASLIGDFERTEAGTTVTLRRFRVLDVYVREQEGWNQAASHTAVDGRWRMVQMTVPARLSPEARQDLLNAREAVWRAFFTNDRAVLEKLVPDDLIAMNQGNGPWRDRATVLADSREFARAGGKLVKLEFPKTEIQVYGSTAIIYTTFRVETEFNGHIQVQQGRGTEMFVQREAGWVNVGWHLDSNH